MRESGVTRIGTALPVVCLSLGELHLRGRDVFPVTVSVVTEVVVALIDMLLLVINTRVGDVIVSLADVLLPVDSTSTGGVTVALTGGLTVVVEVALDTFLLVLSTSLGGVIEALSLRGLSDHVLSIVVAVILK